MTLNTHLKQNKHRSFKNNHRKNSGIYIIKKNQAAYFLSNITCRGVFIF